MAPVLRGGHTRCYTDYCSKGIQGVTKYMKEVNIKMKTEKYPKINKTYWKATKTSKYLLYGYFIGIFTC